MRKLGQRRVDHFAYDHTAASETLVCCNFHCPGLTLELAPQEKLKPHYNGNPHILFPLSLMPLIPLGLVFSPHTFMLKYCILALFLAAIAWKGPRLMNKWGSCKSHGLQRICCTHSYSHKSNLLTFSGSSYVLQNTDLKHEPKRSSHKDNS